MLHKVENKVGERTAVEEEEFGLTPVVLPLSAKLDHPSAVDNPPSARASHAVRGVKALRALDWLGDSRNDDIQVFNDNAGLVARETRARSVDQDKMLELILSSVRCKVRNQGDWSGRDMVVDPVSGRELWSAEQGVVSRLELEKRALVSEIAQDHLRRLSAKKSGRVEDDRASKNERSRQSVSLGADSINDPIGSRSVLVGMANHDFERVYLELIHLVSDFSQSGDEPSFELGCAVTELLLDAQVCGQIKQRFEKKMGYSS